MSFAVFGLICRRRCVASKSSRTRSRQAVCMRNFPVLNQGGVSSSSQRKQRSPIGAGSLLITVFIAGFLSILEIGCSIQPAATNRQLDRPPGNHDAPAAIKRIGQTPMADIFISYTAADRDWAFWIGRQLEKLGHVPRVHEWEIAAGGDISRWMEERHDSADHILCVVSKAYLKAPYSSWERRAAQWAAATERPNFALPVFVESCKAPTLLAPIKRCDLHGLSEDDARARLADYMKPATKPTGPLAFPGAKRAVTSGDTPSDRAPVVFPGKADSGRVGTISNIPITVPMHFLGRDEALAAIDTALKRDEGRVAITALHGLRGVGKTTLAAAYAERHRGDYRATWWIRAQTEPTHARRSRRARRAPRLGRAGREGGAGARDREGAAAARGRGHSADLRQRDRCRRAQALSAARRRGARARHLERPRLARRRRAGRNPGSGRRRSAPII